LATEFEDVPDGIADEFLHGQNYGEVCAVNPLKKQEEPQ